MARPAAHRAQEPDKGNADVGRAQHGQPEHAQPTKNDARCATTALKDIKRCASAMREPRTRRRGEFDTPQPRTAQLKRIHRAQPKKNGEP